MSAILKKKLLFIQWKKHEKEISDPIRHVVRNVEVLMLHCMTNNNLQITKPRVFVSSVFKGYENYREAARLAINKAGGEAILVNEDFPAMATSPRNACLDGVESADIFIIIIGERGGWTTPSNKLVIEEEYLQAKNCKLPVLVFLQQVNRENEVEELVKKLSNWVDGTFRINFQNEVNLQDAVEKALKPIIIHNIKHSMGDIDLQRYFDEPYTLQNEASIRFVLIPGREEEIIDPVKIESEDFHHQLHDIGHSKDVKLFNYKYRKDIKLEGHSLIIHQEENENRRDPFEEVRLELNESGIIVMDSNITGRVARGEYYEMHNTNLVVLDDIKNVIIEFFKFIGEFYNRIDPYKRHQQFFYNIAIVNLGYRKIVKEFEKQTSIEINNFRDDSPIIAYDKPRVININDIRTPEKEIERILTLFIRKSK